MNATAWFVPIATFGGAILAFAGSIIAAIINQRSQTRRERDKTERERAEAVCMRITALMYSCNKVVKDAAVFETLKHAHTFAMEIVAGTRRDEIDKMREELTTIVSIYYDSKSELMDSINSLVGGFLHTVSEHILEYTEKFPSKDYQFIAFKDSSASEKQIELAKRAIELRFAVIRKMREETRQSR